MSYIDGFVIPVPAHEKEAYLAMAAKAATVFKEFGATRRPSRKSSPDGDCLG